MRDMDEVSHVRLSVFHKRQLLCQLKSLRSCFGKQIFGPNDLFSLILWDKLRLIDGRGWSMALHLFEGRSWVADDWHSTTWCGFPQRWPLTPRCLARTNTRSAAATMDLYVCVVLKTRGFQSNHLCCGIARQCLPRHMSFNCCPTMLLVQKTF